VKNIGLALGEVRMDFVQMSFPTSSFAISLVVIDLGSTRHGAGAVVAVDRAVDGPAEFQARADYLGGMRVTN